MAGGVVTTSLLRVVNDHEGKAEILLDHFKSLLGSAEGSSLGMNWAALQLPLVNLLHLEDVSSMAELKEAVFGSPSEKAPGPDGFVGGFFMKC